MLQPFVNRHLSLRIRFPSSLCPTRILSAMLELTFLGVCDLTDLQHW